MSPEGEKIKADLAEMIAEARKLGFWLHCGYQDIWFSPDKLEQENAAGGFLWGPVNWTLRDPKDKLESLKSSSKAADTAYKAFAAKLGVSS